MSTNQPDRLDRIEEILENTAEIVLAHNEALTRIEAAIHQLVETTTQNSQRIEQILEYLFRERPNGRE
jgi:methyl-accepting chemotaxis protein